MVMMVVMMVTVMMMATVMILTLSPEAEVVLLAKLAMMMVMMMMVVMMATMLISTLSPEAVVVFLAKLQLARARVHPPPLLRLFQFQFLSISSGQLRLEKLPPTLQQEQVSGLFGFYLPESKRQGLARHGKYRLCL